MTQFVIVSVNPVSWFISILQELFFFPPSLRSRSIYQFFSFHISQMLWLKVVFGISIFHVLNLKHCTVHISNFSVIYACGDVWTHRVAFSVDIVGVWLPQRRKRLVIWRLHLPCVCVCYQQTAWCNRGSWTGLLQADFKDAEPRSDTAVTLASERSHIHNLSAKCQSSETSHSQREAESHISHPMIQQTLSSLIVFWSHSLFRICQNKVRHNRRKFPRWRCQNVQNISFTITGKNKSYWLFWENLKSSNVVKRFDGSLCLGRS